MRWTQSAERSPALIGCGVVAWQLCDWGLSQVLAPVGAVALAALWTLLGSACHEERLGRSLPARAVEAITWPISRTLTLADRWGWRFTLCPGAALMLLAAGADAAGRSPNLAPPLALLWGAAVTLLATTQGRLDQYANAALPKAPEEQH